MVPLKCWNNVPHIIYKGLHSGKHMIKTCCVWPGYDALASKCVAKWDYIRIRKVSKIVFDLISSLLT